METLPNLDFMRGFDTVERLTTYLEKHGAHLFARRWLKAKSPETRGDRFTEFDDVIFHITGDRDFDGTIRIARPAKEDIEVHEQEFDLNIKQHLGNSESVTFNCLVVPGVMPKSEHPAKIMRHTQIHKQIMQCWGRTQGFDPFDL